MELGTTPISRANHLVELMFSIAPILAYKMDGGAFSGRCDQTSRCESEVRERGAPACYYRSVRAGPLLKEWRKHSCRSDTFLGRVDASRDERSRSSRQPGQGQLAGPRTGEDG